MATSTPDTSSLQQAISPSHGQLSTDSALGQATQQPLQGLGGRLRGVLYGLATGGVLGGVAGAIAPNTARTHFQQNERVREAKTQEVESQAQKSAVDAQFESVRAADSHVQAMKQAQRYDVMNEESRAQIRDLNDKHEKFLTEEYGILPDLTLEGNGQDVHDQATGGLQTLAQQNGGQIPPVAANIIPHTANDPTFKVGAYAPSQQKLQQNQQGYRSMVDDARAVQGLPPIDDLAWNTGGFKGQREMAQGALQFLAPTQSFTKDNIGALLAQRQQLLAQYEKHTDANGTPDAKPAILSQLKDSVAYLQKAKQDMVNSDVAAKEQEAKALQPLELEKARALGQAKAEVEHQIATGGQAALANVPTHLVGGGGTVPSPGDPPPRRTVHKSILAG